MQPRKAPYCYPVRVGFDACPHGVSDVVICDGVDQRDGMPRYHRERCVDCEM